MTWQECIEILFEEESGGEVSRGALVHLGECEDCRTLAREIKANAAVLRSMRDDALPAATVSKEAAKRPRYFYPWAAAAALAGTVGLGFWWSVSQLRMLNQQASIEVTPQPSRPSVAAAMPTLVEPTNSGSSNQQTAAVRRSVRRDASRPVTAAAFRNLKAVAMPTTDPAHPAPVKILTGNPNVVIYLMMGENSVESNDEGEIL